MMEKISLVVTAHRKRYLMEALMSVAAQKNKRFELILCLDLNIENDLKEFCDNMFAKIDCEKKRIITFYGNGTAGACRNHAISNATGDWIAYLDGDDMISPDAMEVLANEIVSNREYDIFSSGMIRIDKFGVANPIEDSLHYYPPFDIYDVDPETIGMPTYFNQLQIMKKEVWEDYKYDTSSNGEDIDFMLIHLLKYKFRKIPQYLYFYRDVEDSFSKEMYEKGDFTTQRYNSGFYHDYYEKKICEKFRGNFKW